MVITPAVSLVLGLTELLSLSSTPQSSENIYTRKTQDASIEAFPYLASLRVNDIHRCGASILSENKLLTAAHCVHQIPAKHLSVRIGSAIHFEGESYPIQDVQIHPSYNRDLLDCDIAFLILGRNLTYSRTVQPIELAERLPVDGTLELSPGWGMLKDGNFIRPDSLKVFTVRLISQEACRPSYPRDVITSRMICGTSADPYGDPCQGSQGGPLIDKSSGKQVGVVSWGISCAQPVLPTIYATVHNLINSKDV